VNFQTGEPISEQRKSRSYAWPNDVLVECRGLQGEHPEEQPQGQYTGISWRYASSQNRGIQWFKTGLNSGGKSKTTNPQKSDAIAKQKKR
jgi:hypothetical protein